jgi:hypothetical protein
MSIYRLVYMSRNEMAGTAEEIEQSIGGILETSRRNNRKVDVGGVLMFNNGGFLQVLEGPLESVTETFERVQCDTRHSDVVILEAGEVPERAFSEWAMAFVGTDSHDAARYGLIKLGLSTKLKMRSDDLLNRLPDILQGEERQLC